jgi:hypothetical protein
MLRQPRSRSLRHTTSVTHSGIDSSRSERTEGRASAAQNDRQHLTRRHARSAISRIDVALAVATDPVARPDTRAETTLNAIPTVVSAQRRTNCVLALKAASERSVRRIPPGNHDRLRRPGNPRVVFNLGPEHQGSERAWEQDNPGRRMSIQAGSLGKDHAPRIGTGRQSVTECPASDASDFQG